MATYEIQTDNGTYQVETEDSQPQVQPVPQSQANPQQQILQQVKSAPLQGGPIIPSAAAVPAAVMGGLQWLESKLGGQHKGGSITVGGKQYTPQLQGGPVMPRPSGLLVNGEEIPTVGQGLLGSLPKVPSYDRAGQNFEAVKQAAGNTPVDVSEAGNHALRIQEMAGRGGSQPKVVRDFVSRATNPNAAPLTYSELRDFASNASRLSADEAGRLTPAMKREMGAFANSLNSANEQAAEQAGVGDKYRAAMSEYRNAARVNDFKQGVKDAAKSQLVKTVGGGLLGYEALKKMGLL